MSETTSPAAITEEQVREALQRVTDFDRGADVVSLGMVSEIAVGENGVFVTLQVDPKEAPGKEPLRVACERTLRNVLGIERVTAVLTAHRSGETAEPEGGEAQTAEARIIEGLHTVYDPEIPVDLYELGLIYDIRITDDNRVEIDMTLTAPGCPVAEILPVEVESAVRSHYPEASDVEVRVVWDPPWTPDRMSEVARLELGFF
jgi:FeS assembly SUF system protein